MTLTEIVEQLRSCNYECEAGRLEDNVAFVELVQMAEPDKRPALVTTEYGHRFIVGTGEIVCVPWGDKIVHIAKVRKEPMISRVEMDDEQQRRLERLMEILTV